MRQLRPFVLCWRGATRRRLPSSTRPPRQGASTLPRRPETEGASSIKALFTPRPPAITHGRSLQLWTNKVSQPTDRLEGNAKRKENKDAAGIPPRSPIRLPTKDKHTKSKRTIRINQINLAKSPLAWEDLKIQLDRDEIDAVLISEPPKCLQLGRTIPSEYTWTYQQNESMSGAGILYRKNLRVTKPIEDTPRINTIAVKRENNTALWISSFYLQPETLEGLHDVQKVGIEAIKTDSHWILGGDANAHFSLWRQADNNECGNREDWILENSLLVINDRDSEATFSRKSTQDQWLDITLSTQGISRQITEWQVKKEAIPNSDHSLIHWEIDGQDAKLTDLKQRSWAKTNWEEYRDLVQAFLPTLPLRIDSIARLEEQTHLLTKALSTAMKLTTKMVEPKKIPRNWFDQEAQKLHNRLRASKKGTNEHNAIRSEWKELVRNKKLLSFQKFTESTNDQNCWEALRRLSYPKKLKPIHTLTDQN